MISVYKWQTLRTLHAFLILPPKVLSCPLFAPPPQKNYASAITGWSIAPILLPQKWEGCFSLGMVMNKTKDYPNWSTLSRFVPTILQKGLWSQGCGCKLPFHSIVLSPCAYFASLHCRSKTAKKSNPVANLKVYFRLYFDKIDDVDLIWQ